MAENKGRARLEGVLARLRNARANAPLASGEARLIAVTKGRSMEEILPLLEAGQRDFGENRVREASLKWESARSVWPDIALHCIGPLQTNKVPEALATFDVIHTLDREALATAIAREKRKSAVRCRRFFVQVNTGEESQKSGVAPQGITALLAAIQELLPIEGLMCIPTAKKNPAPHFALLRNLARAHSLFCLSMGMSADFETALRFGATHIRVGTALFE
jgi:pyridoxal phosphate enzyme (YggS family)